MRVRAVLPWAALVVAGVVALAFGRSRSVASELAPMASTAPEPDRSRMTPAEARDFRIHVGHEECELGVSRVNELEGREPHAPNPKIISELSICLRIGNLAWSKCIAGATTSDQAHVCNIRFLNLDHPPG